MAISVLKPHIFRCRSYLRLPWPRTVSDGDLLFRRLPRLPLILPRPRRLHFLPNSFSFPTRTNLPGFPSPHLLRRRPPSLSATMSSMTSDDAKTVKVVVKGRVQGVFFRNWTVDNAKELGLKGWVRNRRDGSVEALFSGSLEKVQEMEQRRRRGPPDAMVTGFQVLPCTDEDPGTTFERKPTV